jgi:hypothetical protein
MESMSTLDIFSLILSNLDRPLGEKTADPGLDQDLTRINVLDTDSQRCLSKPSMEAIRVYCFMVFTRDLKVHKRDNFFGSNFEFCTFL